MANEVIKKISEHLSELTHEWGPAEVMATPLMGEIIHKIERMEPLLFILPAFPAKSPSPEKTCGHLPDYGEVIALNRLNQFCQNVSAEYIPGAKVVICSDGRAFGDLVHVSDEVIDRYNEGVQSIIEDFALEFLSVFTMEDVYPELDATQLRDLLLREFAKPVSEVREMIKEDDNYRALFNGIHRFLIEDERALFSELSKNQLNKRSKHRTYELIRRSDSWGELLRVHFANALRFSIHPYPVGHEKFGVKLVPGPSRWATPWHNVTVKLRDHFELMHLKDALKLGATKKLFEDKYAYFEIARAQ